MAQSKLNVALFRITNIVTCVNRLIQRYNFINKFHSTSSSTFLLLLLLPFLPSSLPFYLYLSTCRYVHLFLYPSLSFLVWPSETVISSILWPCNSICSLRRNFLSTVIPREISSSLRSELRCESVLS